MLVGTLSPFGMNLIILKKLSLPKHEREETLSKSLGTISILSLFLVAIYIPTSTLILPDSRDITWVIIFIGVAEIIIQPFILLSSTSRLAQDKTAISQIVILLPLAFRLAVSFFLYLADTKNALFYYSMLYPVLSALALFISVVTLKPSWPSPKRWRTISLKEARENFGYALVGTSNRASSEVDKILSVSLLSLSLAGTYSAAARVVGAINTPIVGLILAALPKLFKDLDDKRRKEIHQKIFITTIIYGASVSAVTYLAAPYITLIFSEQYNHMEEFIRIMSFSIPVLALRLTGTNILISIKGAGYRASLEVSGIAIMILFSFILSGHSILALPYSIIISETCISLLSWLYIFFHNKNHKEYPNTQ